MIGDWHEGIASEAKTDVKRVAAGLKTVAAIGVARRLARVMSTSGGGETHGGRKERLALGTDGK